MFQQWERYLSPTGHWYYYNKSTQLSTYDPPDFPVLIKEIAGQQVTVTRHGKLYCGSGSKLPEGHNDDICLLLAESRGYKAPQRIKKDINRSTPAKSPPVDKAPETQAVKNQSIESEKKQQLPVFEQYDEPAFSETTTSVPVDQQPDDEDTEAVNDDPQAFLKFLDSFAKPDLSWKDQEEELAIHDEFDLLSATNRPKVFQAWAKKHSCSFLELLKTNWQKGVFYAQFKQKFASHPSFGTEFSDKQQETIYRDYTRFNKKTVDERKELLEIYKDDPIRVSVLHMLD